MTFDHHLYVARVLFLSLYIFYAGLVLHKKSGTHNTAFLEIKSNRNHFVAPGIITAKIKNVATKVIPISTNTLLVAALETLPSQLDFALKYP